MKTALITGVGRGIGKALAEKFLAEGYAVIGTTQTGSADPGGPRMSAFKMDLSSSESIRECVEAIMRTGAKIDVLINNAGAIFDDGETELEAPKLRKTLEVNLIGTADFTERMIVAMNPGGHIIFVSSAAGSLTDMDDIGTSHSPYHYPAYKISKTALNMYMRTLAARLTHEKYKITVSAVHPGWVRTDMGGGNAPILPEEAAANIFMLAESQPETGRFWYKGEKYPW